MAEQKTAAASAAAKKPKKARKNVLDGMKPDSAAWR